MADLGTVGVVITPEGIIAPDYDDVLQQLKSAYWSIYGSDADLDADTQDGQFLSIVALAIYNCGQTGVAIYNSFSPATAQGIGLSSVVKINGISRQVASNSQAVVTIVGTVGTTITGGSIGSPLNDNTTWSLPPSVTIPDAGEIDVTATCDQIGATPAPAGAWRILTPTRGWQSVTSAVAASPGNPVESDAALRQRQGQSTALPAQSVIDAIYGAVAAVPGVSRLQVYENDSDATDDNGIPSHSISAVVLGGDATTIAETIAGQKTPGTGTYGDVSELVLDSRGVPATIRFYELSLVRLKVEIDLTALTGYTSAIGTTVQTTVAAYVTALAIGEDSYLSRLFSAADIGGAPGNTYVVAAIRQGREGGPPPSAANVALAFNEAAFSDLVDVTVSVV